MRSFVIALMAMVSSVAFARPVNQNRLDANPVFKTQAPTVTCESYPIRQGKELIDIVVVCRVGTPAVDNTPVSKFLQKSRF